MSNTVLNPFIPYLDLSGDALNNGSIYIGQSGFVAQSAPLTVYWDRALKQDAAQPLKTLNGNIQRGGTPANVFIDAADYSISIIDSQNRTVFNTLSAFESGFVDGSSGSGAVTATATPINVLQNTNFENNYSGSVGTIILASDQYGHDLYRGGVNGCTYTISATNNVNTVNIVAGNLYQIATGKTLFNSEYTLSWEGTAQASINGSGLATSPILVSVVGGVDQKIEWSVGTVSKPQFEIGGIANAWILGLNKYLVIPSTGNSIINGRVTVTVRPQVSQAAGQYVTDMWRSAFANITQLTEVSTAIPQTVDPSVKKSLRIYTAAAVGTINAADYASILQAVEGFNFIPLSEKKTRITFEARAQVSGTYSVSFRNGATNLSCVVEFNLLANQWTYVSLPVPASPGSGTWDYANGTGVFVSFAIACGTTFKAPTANEWLVGNYQAGPNQVNGLSATGGLYIADVKWGIDFGYGTIFLDRQYSDEVDACKRYWQVIRNTGQGYGLASQSVGASMLYPVAMRTAPTVTLSSQAYNNASALIVSIPSTVGADVLATVTATGAYTFTGVITFDAGL
jgi:hypothetical protein